MPEEQLSRVSQTIGGAVDGDYRHQHFAKASSSLRVTSECPWISFFHWIEYMIQKYISLSPPHESTYGASERMLDLLSE